MDMNDPRSKFRDIFSLTGQITGTSSGQFDGRKCRRCLFDHSCERGKGGENSLAGRAIRTCFANFAFTIVRGTAFSPANPESIRFLAVHYAGNRFCRFTQGNRQNTAGQRVQGSAVSRLGGTDHFSCTRNDSRRGKPHRLVNIQPSVNGKAGAFTAHRAPDHAELQGCAAALRFVQLVRSWHQLRRRDWGPSANASVRQFYAASKE